MSANMMKLEAKKSAEDWRLGTAARDRADNGSLQSAEVFNTEATIRLTGATARQLQWWDGQGILSPQSKAGHRKLYSADQLVMIFVIKELRRKGFSPQKIWPIVSRLNLIAPLDPASFVLTDGENVHVEADHARMIAIWSDVGSRMACVSLDLFGDVGWRGP